MGTSWPSSSRTNAAATFPVLLLKNEHYCGDSSVSFEKAVLLPALLWPHFYCGALKTNAYWGNRARHQRSGAGSAFTAKHAKYFVAVRHKAGRRSPKFQQGIPFPPDRQALFATIKPRIETRSNPHSEVCRLASFSAG